MNEIMASAMSGLATIFGGQMGWAILALALSARLALLPLTLYLSRKMLANQRKIKALQPQVDALKERLAADPRAMFLAISALYKANGAHILDRSSVVGALVQLPVFGLLYKAVGNAASGSSSFLWMKNLASPDVLLTAIVLVLTALSAYYFPSVAPETAMAMIVMQVLVTALIMWKLSAAMGLYWAASASVSVAQTFILRQEERRLSAHPAC